MVAYLCKLRTKYLPYGYLSAVIRVPKTTKMLLSPLKEKTISDSVFQFPVVLQFTNMSYPTNLLLYEDEPAGWIFKFFFMIVTLVLLAGSVYFWVSGDNANGLTMLVVAFVLGLAFWIVSPRKYQVYGDRLQILLGGPFVVKIGFDQIAAIEVTDRTTSELAAIKLISKVTNTYVRIGRKKGLSITITPKSDALFVENTNRSLHQWQETDHRKSLP